MQLILLVCIATIPGCGLSVLSNGQLSTMDSDDAALRMGLTIDPVPLPVQLSYLSRGVCVYNEKTAIISQPPTDGRLTITITPVKNNLYFVFNKNDGKISGYLIDRTGKLYNFNFQSVTSSEASNPETYSRLSQKLLSETQASKPLFSGDVHIVNPFTMEFPEFVRNIRAPGDVAAHVQSQDGNGWGTYTYMGTTRFRGTEAAVFDLTRDEPPGSTHRPFIMGFTIVDLRTAMPLYFGFKSGSLTQLSQISCS